MYSEYPISFDKALTPSRTENSNWRAVTTLDPPKPPITIPTSCLHFGFSVQESNQQAGMGFRNDSSFDSYTTEQLAKLTAQGLRCELHVPSSVHEVKAQTTSKEPQHQSVCFPWGVFTAYGVSNPSDARDVSFASSTSEISAAVSAALSMFETLAKFADDKHGGQHVPPVIAIASVGASITVWLAYCDLVDDKIRHHVGTLTSEFKKEETNKSTGNDQHLGGYDHQDLGRHSILPHHRQSFFLGLALLEA